MSEPVRYFLVDKKSAAHKAIGKLFADRAAGFAARWKFVNEHFPGSEKRKADFQIASFMGPRQWAVCVPDGYPIPPLWKKLRHHNCYEPRQATKEGKALAKYMRSDECMVPGPDSLASELGIGSVWKGMVLYGIGISVANDGRYTLNLVDGHKPPSGCKRISDLEYERLMEKPKKPRKKAVAKS